MQSYDVLYPCQVAMLNNAKTTIDPFVSHATRSYDCKVIEKRSCISTDIPETSKESCTLEKALKRVIFREMCEECPYRIELVKEVKYGSIKD